MALFQKKPQVSDNLPLYSIGAIKTALIIGLGNPGKEYIGTRHNIGYAVLEEFAKDNEFPQWIDKKDLRCQITVKNMGQSRVILCKPTTFMNLGGEAARTVQHFYKVYNLHTLAVYDELAIPFGQIRARVGGSDAGHNGVKSLIRHIGEDFGRLRVGVGPLPSGKDSADFVLSEFSKKEQVGLPQIIREANALITEFIFGEGLVSDTRSVV